MDARLVSPSPPTLPASLEGSRTGPVPRLTTCSLLPPTNHLLVVTLPTHLRASQRNDSRQMERRETATHRLTNELETSAPETAPETTRKNVKRGRS